MENMIQLRPPADADNYRVQAGRFGDRFYTDPLPADDTWDATTDDDIYPAISTVKKAAGNDWSHAMAKRLAQAPSQLVEIGNLDSEFERKARINLLSDTGLGKASGRGTIVHAHAEAVLTNRIPMYQMDDVVKPYIRTLDSFFAAYNPVLVAAEFVAINRTLNSHGLQRDCQFKGYGGTGDAVIEIDGKLWLVDWKSRAEDSDHKAYPEEAAQVSAYGRADYWIVGDDTSPNGAKRIKLPDLAGGLIVSIKPDSYECFPIDLDEGFAYWIDLHAWWQARRSERRSIGRKWAPRVPTSELVESPSREFIAAVAEADPGGAMKKAMEQQPRTLIDLHSTGELEAAPTPASNRARFDALPDIKKGWARKKFEQRGIKPSSPDYAGEVSRILGEIEQEPTLREAQETRAEQVAERSGPVDFKKVGEAMATLEAEGGEADEALVNEARLMFEMVIGAYGKAWTGFRVAEANEAGTPFQVSALRSARRANLYLALTRWAAFRGETLVQDEAEGNIEFRSIMLIVDGVTNEDVTIGNRLGIFSAEEAEKLLTEVTDVVTYETGDEFVTEPEPQPTK